MQRKTVMATRGRHRRTRKMRGTRRERMIFNDSTQDDGEDEDVERRGKTAGEDFEEGKAKKD